jgi:dihydroflavonol-4-reductase
LASAGLPLTAAYSALTGKRNIFTRLTLEALGGNPQIDDGLARRELGYTSRPFEDTITDSVRWFAEQGMAPPLPVKRETIHA